MSHMLCIGYGRFPPQSLTDMWLTMLSMIRNINNHSNHSCLVIHSPYISISDIARIRTAV